MEIELRVIGNIKGRALKLIDIKNSTVKKNFIALSALQITNYIFPLVTLPYISKIFGASLFGLINFATSFLSYFWLLVNYGFDLSASREISQNRSDKEKVNEIFNKVLFSKLMLYFFATLIFLLCLFSIKKINSYQTLYLLMFFGGFFNIFFPTWFFQGIERLILTAIFSFIIKLIFTILTFIIIKTQEDFIIYPLTTIIGQIIVAIISIYIITKHYEIKIRVPKVIDIFNTLKNQWRIFGTTVVINLYTTSNFVILGFLSNDYNVGIFTAASKMVSVIMGLILYPMNQSLYPNIGYSFTKSIDEGVKKINSALRYVIIINLPISLILFLIPNFFINTFFGVGFKESIKTLQILAFLPLIIGLSNVFGIQGLLNLRKDEYMYSITIVGAILGLSLNFLLVPSYGYIGTAISWLITEIIITLLTYIAFKKFIKNN